MKIVFLDSATLGHLDPTDRLKQYGELTLYKTSSHAETLERVREADIIITNKVVINKDVINVALHLKLICVVATGTNNIDLNFAASKGIEVKNVSGYSTSSVAQLTFGFIFYLLNHLAAYNKYVCSGKYSQSSIFTNLDLEINQLEGKNIGIIGLGTIGTKVAEIATSFGAIASYYSSSGVDRNLKYQRKELSTLLQESDIVTIHAPLNDKTFKLINYSNIKLMKPNALLLNLGRGGIVDEAALAMALEEKLIGGAGIDVFEKEPPDAANPLLLLKDKENIILTPHIGWGSMEARAVLLEKTCINIENFLNNRPKSL